jgi:hypothetical protein
MAPMRLPPNALPMIYVFAAMVALYRYSLVGAVALPSYLLTRMVILSDYFLALMMALPSYVLTGMVVMRNYAPALSRIGFKSKCRNLKNKERRYQNSYML